MFSSSSVSNVDNNGEGDSLSEDSNTKKVRFKESNVIPEDVMSRMSRNRLLVVFLQRFLGESISTPGKGNVNLCGTQDAWLEPWNHDST
ncbi:hypothetical protein Goshw_007233 [Gossypium schwendimanii]|uniref:Uncharacterized protein n=1 Tax=Gossypium schwendimanii TaxID=34291 RepID=A0A7J9LLE3_GOSSC|nr:hypothetical protein [Gossypium schwendimanii]